MKTLRLSPDDITTAAAILSRGEIVAFPTDTVYGIAIRYDLPKAIEKLIKVKQRPETKPFPLMVSSLSQIEELASLSDRDYQLIRHWMPGDVTFIFNKQPFIQSGYFAEATSIAFRMPNDPFILELISQIKKGLLVPSANISGTLPSLTSDEVLAQFDGLIEAVVIGSSGQKQASTIIDATQETLKVLRQGRVALDEIESSLKENL